MSDRHKKEESPLSNVVNIDQAKIKRLKKRGNPGAMLEEYEKLRLKLLYDQPMNKQEAQRLVLLCKYFMEHGPTESFRMSCQFMYDKYIKPWGL